MIGTNKQILQNRLNLNLKDYSSNASFHKLSSEWIYEVIVSSKIPSKNYRDFCSGSLLEGRAKISVIFGWDFGGMMTS